MRRRTLQPRSPPSYIGVRMPSLARALSVIQDGGGAATTREKVPRTLKSCITRAYSKTCDAARCTYREIIWRRDQPIGQSPRPCFVDVVARRLGPQVVQPSLRLVFIFGRASV